MQPFQTGFSHLGMYMEGPSMSSHALIAHLSLVPHSIPVSE